MSDTTTADESTENVDETAAAESSGEQAAQSEPDWKKEARKWEARAKANSHAAKQLEALTAQASAKDADLEALRAKVKAFEHEREVAGWKEQVASDTGVPASLLRGDSLEDLQAHAAEVKTYMEEHARPHGPVVPMAGTTPQSEGSPLRSLAAGLFGNS